MARRALGPATLRAVQAVGALLSGPTGGRVRWLVGCSGGPDSLALAAAALRVAADRPEVDVAAVVVDHGLQPGSGQAATAAAGTLRELGYLDAVVRTATPGPGGVGPEAAARAARYAVLDREAADRDADLLLGHTRDDQAETVLLGLLRGSGTRSLAGMAPRVGRRVRPFLGLARADTEAVCVELGLTPWRDPHNDDPRFRRVLVRRLLPDLAHGLGAAPGSLVGALARTAELARDDADLLDDLAEALASRARIPGPEDQRGGQRFGQRFDQPDGEFDCADDPGELDCAVLADAPRALRGRVLRGWLVRAGASEPGFGHVRAVEALLSDWHGQRFVQVPGLRVARTAGRLVATRSAVDPRSLPT